MSAVPGQPLTRAAIRREQIAGLYLTGRSQLSIAQELGVTQQCISQDLKRLHATWEASALANIDAKKALELAKIDQVEREAWQAWTRSQQPREIRLTDTTKGGEVILADGTKMPKAPIRKTSVRYEGQSGDPRFLERIQKCIDQRCAIIGIGAREEALKNAGLGLAALLEEARQQTVLPDTPPPSPMAEA